jgi:hypothetical protein
MANNVSRAPLGKVFLVYGECECGWTMAAPEGSSWPKCPECGTQVLPPRHTPEGPGDHGDRQAYVLLPEGEALARARALVAERNRELLSPRFDAIAAPCDQEATVWPVRSPAIFAIDDILHVPRTGEHALVNGTDVSAGVTVKRGLGGSTPAPLEAGDDVLIVGVADRETTAEAARG